MKNFKVDSSKLKKLIKNASDQLSGEWVLLGGTLLPYLGIDYRSTVDVDLVGMNNPDQKQAIILMDLAQDLGWPVESINQAAGYFLQKVKNFEDHLIVLQKGKSATIYRPDLYLFTVLKLGRCTHQDIDDCEEMIKFEGKNVDAGLKKNTKSVIEDAIKSTVKPETKAALEKLLKMLK